jgi:D-3-phosphoglycerate dehydrogenase
MQIDGNVIVCDSIDERGIGILKNAGLLVEYLPEISNQELITKVKDYDVIIVRSRTKITKEIIDNATNAKIIARV